MLACWLWVLFLYPPQPPAHLTPRPLWLYRGPSGPFSSENLNFGVAWCGSLLPAHGCVDPVWHIPPGRRVPPSGGDNKGERYHIAEETFISNARLVFGNFWFVEEAVNMTNALFSLDSLTRKAKTSADGNGDFGQKLFRVYQKLESSPLPFPEPLKCFLLDLENRKATLKQREGRERERERERKSKKLNRQTKTF